MGEEKMVNIIAVLLCSMLWRAGGEWKGWLRDTLVPIIIALCFAWNTKTWWLFPIIAGTYQIIRLGYGINSPLKKLFKWEPLVRGAYGAICATLGALPIALFTHAWLSYFYYILLCALAQGLLVWLDDKFEWINVWSVEIGSGAAIASVLLII